MELVNLDRIIGNQPFERIYLEAFPAEERIALTDLQDLSDANVNIYLSQLEQAGEMCGLAIHYALPGEKGFLLYFAMDSRLRGQGIGTQALALFKQIYPGGIILECELIGENAENEELRQARYRFYLRNGLSDSGTISENMGGKYHLMRSTAQITPLEYQEAVHHFGIKATLMELND